MALTFRCTVIKGLAMPPATRKKEERERYKYPFDAMEVGDAFKVPEGVSATNISSVVSVQRRRGQLPEGFAVVVRELNGEQYAWRIS